MSEDEDDQLSGNSDRLVDVFLYQRSFIDLFGKMVCSGKIWETKLNFVFLVCCWIPMWCFVFLTGEYYIIWTWLNLYIQKATRLKSSCCKIHLLQGSRQTKSQHIKMKHIKHETQISTIKHKQTAKQSHVFITFLMISLNVSESSRHSLKMAETSVLEKMFQSKIKSNQIGTVKESFLSFS